MSEFHLEDISNEEHRDSGAEAFARHSEIKARSTVKLK